MEEQIKIDKVEQKNIESAKEEEYRIVIKKSTEAPPEVKERNPFYDPEYWGRAFSPDNIYLPDSDEGISLPVAGHEIGHLVKDGEILDARLDNFKATRAEEQRAWDKGWPYLKKYLSEYYQDNPETIPKIQQAFEQIKDLWMQGVDISKEMYFKKGTLSNLSEDERERIGEERLKEFFSTEKGREVKSILEQTKKEKIGQKPDWDRFTGIVTKAVEDILRDNEENKKSKIAR